MNQVISETDPGYPWTPSGTGDIRFFDFACLEENYLALANGELYFSECSGGRPDAHVFYFKVVDDIAMWDTVFELGTERYVVETSESISGPWRAVGEASAGTGRHTLALDAGGPRFVRLVEVEASGTRHPIALDVRHSSESVESASTSSAFSSASVSGSEHSLQYANTNPCTIFASDPTYVIFTTSTMLNAVDCNIGEYREQQGQRVRVVDVGQFSNVAEDIKAYIADCYSNYGTRYFHLIGTWEDDFSSAIWTSSETLRATRDAYARTFGRSTRSGNTIPTFLVPSSSEFQTARGLPYVYSDQQYGDVDDDGVPDVVVTRWPMDTATEMHAVFQKVLEHEEEGAVPERVSFFVGDYQYGLPDLEAINPMIEDLISSLDAVDPSQTSTTFFWSDHIANKNLDAASHLNTFNPHALFMISRESGSWAPGVFFDKSSANPWHMDMLQTDRYARVIVAASCESANFTQVTEFGRATCIDFLASSDRGAIAWVGPAGTSFQAANHAISRHFLEELYGDPHRSMADSWLIAMQQAYADVENYPELYPTVASYVFLGDPLTPFARRPYAEAASFRRLPNNPALFPTPPSVAVGCPQGDANKLIVELKMDAAAVAQELPAEALSLKPWVDNDLLKFFPVGAELVADSLPVLFPPSGSFSNGFYRTTFTASPFAGCQQGDVDVRLYGQSLVRVSSKTRSPDLNANGTVDVVDFALFSDGGVPREPVPGDCSDFNNDDKVDTIDFATFGGHNGHHSAQALLAGDVTVSNSGIVLRFTEEFPTATSHKLYVDIDARGFADVDASLFALVAGNERLSFVGWTRAQNSLETVVFAPVSTGETEQLYFGTRTAESYNGSTTALGRLTFDVSGLSTFEIAEGDFQMVTGGVLLESDGPVPVVARMAGVLDRALDPAIARIYHNRLEQNFPNPFNPSTTLAFSMKDDGNVNLTIYDVAGRRVRELVDEPRRRGAYKVVWDGRNEAGETVASGVYFYKLVASAFTSTKKMTILK